MTLSRMNPRPVLLPATACEQGGEELRFSMENLPTPKITVSRAGENGLTRASRNTGERSLRAAIERRAGEKSHQLRKRALCLSLQKVRG